MTTIAYEYKPLTDNEIRILEVQPSAYSNELIQATLIDTHLDALPPYTALSYTWGDPSKCENILLGRRVLSITESLELALRALRRPDRSVLLWIDQTCINQQDDKEKSHQIPLMRAIYSRSVQTIGWLGVATANSDAAMQYMIRIGQHTSRMGLATLDDKQLALLLADEADIQSGMVAINAESRRWRDAVYQMISVEGSLLNHTATEGMIELCHRPYFTRDWIQQEIAIPSRMLFKWGNFEIDATAFAAATYFQLIFVQAGIRSLLTPQMMQDERAMSLLSRLRTARIWAHIQPSMILRQHYHDPTSASRLSTARVIERLRRIEFGVARDRLYGILGVVNDGDTIVPNVDVKRTYEEVFTHATKLIINKPVTETNSVEGINFLSLRHNSTQPSENLPSWVPDLTHIGQVSTLLNGTTTLVVPYHASRGAIHTPASAGLPANQIRVRGVIVDRIMETGPVWMTDESGEK